MKKVLSIILMALVVTAVFVSCDQPKHEHSYSQEHDETKHWMECSCDDKKDEEAHTFEVVNSGEKSVKKCKVCDYTTEEGLTGVSTAETLKSAISDSKTDAIYLTQNIEGLTETIEVKKSLILNLNGKKISSSGVTAVKAIGKDVVLTIEGNGEIVATKTGNNVSAVQAIDDGKVIIKNGKFSGTFAVAAGLFAPKTVSSAAVISNGHVVIEDGEFKSSEFTVPVWGKSSAVINGGAFTADDNAVIGTNGSTELSSLPYTITIKGGTFNGNITTAGYIACGIYMANTGTVNLSDGTFNITGGVGVLVRSGKLNATAGTITLKTKEGLSTGKVGDSTVTIKTDSQIVVDDKAGYPGDKPEVTSNTANYAVKDTSGNDYVKTAE